MDNKYESIMKELKELKLEVEELKKNIEKKDIEIKKLKDYLKINKKNNNSDNELEEIIKSNDLNKCYQFILNNQDKDCSILEQIIIDSKDLDVNYKYLTDLGGSRFNDHLKVIMDSKDPRYNYLLAVNLDLDLEDIAKIRQIIIDSNDLECIYSFATDLKYIYKNEDVSKMDTSDLEAKILDGCDLKYYYLYCKKVSSANTKLFQEYLLDLADEESINYVFFFAMDVKDADLEKCKNKIIQLYKRSNNKHKIHELIDECERIKSKCLFRNSFCESLTFK